MWIFNHDLSPSNVWKHRPFTLRLPSELPSEIQSLCVVLELHPEVEDLAPAAIRKGMFLTRAMLEFLQKSVKYKMPNPKLKEGSGKGGVLKKEDYAWHAVQHFFGSESDDEKMRMYRGIMNSTAEVVPCREELLEAIDKLDPVFQEDFDFMKKVCKQQKKRQEKVSAPGLNQPAESVASVPVEVVRVPDPEPREIKTDNPKGEEPETPRIVTPHMKSAAKLYTPESLNELIPGRGNLKHVRIKRLPGLRKTYQGFYPGPRFPNFKVLKTNDTVLTPSCLRVLCFSLGFIG